MNRLKNAQIFGYQLSLITFIRLSTILRLSHYAIYIHPKYIFRGLFILSTSIIATPLHILEWCLFRKKIENVKITQPPVFIIGHWRSGTTHLHNLISIDKKFGYLTMYQAIVPDSSIIGGRWLKRLLAMVLPAKRPMDNMVWNMDTPQEEEVALCRMMPYSFYTQFIYPQKALSLFDRGVLLLGTSDKIREEIKQKYLKLLKIVTLGCGGKQLILKNPVNTARISLLLELFPNAKFIHIHRSPLEVFVSTRNLHNKLLSITTLQDTSDRRPDEIIYSLYKKLMQRYFDEKNLIPKENLVELGFKDLEDNPLEQLERIYKTLNLGDFKMVKPEVESYLSTLTTYRKNNFSLNREEIECVEQQWAFSYDELGYLKSTKAQM